jgi:hypothetical protein
MRVRSEVGRAGWVPIGDDFYLPPRFEMDWASDGHQPSLRMQFEVIDGAPQCVDVQITRVPGGRAVQASDLRVASRVEDWTRGAAALVAEPMVERSGGAVATTPSRSASDAKAALAAIARSRRNKITDQFLRRVAEVYRAHVEDAPTAAVAEQFNVSHRTAGDYLRQARERGHLGAAIKGKAGEQR